MSCNGRRDSSSLPEPKFQVCVVGCNLKGNDRLITAVQKFNLPIVFSENGLENKGAEFTTIYILENFEGEPFKSLQKSGQRILGPTVVIQCAEKNESLPGSLRPLYTMSMKDLIITFTGFREKKELSELAFLIHCMGGIVRGKYSMSKTTHLLAAPSRDSTTGEKYKWAASLGTPIMTPQWIYQVWAKRDDPSCKATDEEFMQYKMLPLVGCKIAFVGYQSGEEDHMVDVALKSGGEIVEPTDSSCTHIVVEDGTTINSSEYNSDAFIVKNEWFWACMQMEAKAEESIYAFENPNVVSSSSSFIMPVRGNKRKRLENVAHQLAMESLQEIDFFTLSTDLKKKSDVAKLSISGSFLDATFSPDKSLDISADVKDIDAKAIKSPPFDMRSLSPRQQVCFELFHTESNYVGILHTIISVFKEPLENEEKHPLLAPAEIKIIFGNLPPIFEIHQKLRNELALVIESWREDHSIGNLILNHAPELMKAYPPFVNFFEKTKEVLNNCDATKPRFHAFLKRCQSRPECGRQTLQELLIRPVQRLPSVILLLTDILKHTQKSNPDYAALESAIQALKDVMLHINEDKRKTEGQVAMFDIVNDIENCPPNLLSSHRNLVLKADMIEVTDLLNKKSGVITMFLFTDVLEICKKRNKASNTLKSPGVTSLTTGTLKTQSKSYKHLDLINLSHIRRVVDITEAEDFKNHFALVTWSSKERKELLYVFILLEDFDKSSFLTTFCRQVANTVCKADAENLLTSLEAHHLSLQSDGTGNALTKALNKTRDKLSRALSMKRTPIKRGLSRAVSTIISPLTTFGNSSSNMGSFRLSSVANLTEFDSTSNNSLAPSPVGAKKLKSNSLGVTAQEYI